MNKTQRTIISIAVPLIVILIGFVLIGDSGSASVYSSGAVFDPIQYFSRNGIKWSIVTIIISAFELFLWKTPKEKSE